MAGIVEDADNRPTTPEAGNNDPFTVNEDAELLVSFHGWDPIDSDQPPAVQSLLLGKDVNKEPPPLPQGQHNPLGGGGLTEGVASFVLGRSRHIAARHE
jgi:hypothetical protein